MKLRIRKDGDKYYPEVYKFFWWSPLYIDYGIDLLKVEVYSLEEAEHHIDKYIASLSKIKRGQEIVKEYEV